MLCEHPGRRCVGQKTQKDVEAGSSQADLQEARIVSFHRFVLPCFKVRTTEKSATRNSIGQLVWDSFGS